MVFLGAMAYQKEGAKGWDESTIPCVPRGRVQNRRGEIRQRHDNAARRRGRVKQRSSSQP